MWLVVVIRAYQWTLGGAGREFRDDLPAPGRAAAQAAGLSRSAIRFRWLSCGSSNILSTYLILANDAAEDGFSTDPSGVQVDDLRSRVVRVVSGDALGNAPVRARGVVMSGVPGQDGVHVRLVQDQDPVEQLAP